MSGGEELEYDLENSWAASCETLRLVNFQIATFNQLGES